MNGTGHRPGRRGVIDDRTLDDSAIRHGRHPAAIRCRMWLYVLPAKPTGPARAVRLNDGAFGIIAASLAWQPYTNKPLAGSKDDAAIGIVPGVALVLAHDRKLDTIDGQQLGQGKTKRLGSKNIDFDQGLPAGVVAAQGAVTLPHWREF